VANAGNVASWPIEAGDKPDLHWVNRGAEDDRNACCRGLSGKRGRTAGRNCDHGHTTTDQISGHLWQPINLVVSKTKFDRDVAAFDVAGFAQTLTKFGDDLCLRLKRPKVKISYYRHPRLLRPRRQRPRRGGIAEKGDEGAAVHRSHFIQLLR